MYLLRETGRRQLEVQAVKEDYNLDEQAQNIGLITGVYNEIYYCSISYVSTVYLECIDGSWTAWRESYIPKSNKRTSYKVIATGSFELVIARLKNYLNYIKRSK